MQEDTHRVVDVLRGIGVVLAVGTKAYKDDDDDDIGATGWPGLKDVVEEVCRGGDVAHTTKAHLSMAKTLALKGLAALHAAKRNAMDNRRPHAVFFGLEDDVRRRRLCKTSSALVVAPLTRSARGLEAPAASGSASAALEQTNVGPVARDFAASLRDERRVTSLVRVDSRSVGQLSWAGMVREEVYQRELQRRSTTRSTQIWLAKNAKTMLSRGFQLVKRDDGFAVNPLTGVVMLVVRGLVVAQLSCADTPSLTAAVTCSGIELLFDMKSGDDTGAAIPVVLQEPSFVMKEITNTFTTRGTDAGLLAILAIASGALMHVLGSQLNRPPPDAAKFREATVTGDANNTAPFIRCALHENAVGSVRSVMWSLEISSLRVLASKTYVDGRDETEFVIPPATATRGSLGSVDRTVIDAWSSQVWKR